MTHASLFSGIGGFDLAAQWAGFENLFNCEIDPFCQRILNYHFPDAKQYSDIKSTDFTLWRGRIDILSGGFPCQPFSLAGKRKGTSDDRHLWPQMLRAIREIKPRWVVGENVLGIVSWDKGVVFEQVCLDLEAEGYEVQPYILPACGVDAPHQRYRIWFVAHRTNPRAQGVQGSANGVLSSKNATGPNRKRRSKFNDSIISNQERQPSRCLFEGDATDPNNNGSYGTENRQGLAERNNDYQTWTEQTEQLARRAISRSSTPTDPTGFLPQGCEDRPWKIKPWRGSNGCIPSWADFPTQPPVCSRNDGISAKLDGITFPKWREQSIKAYGNAVVPQVVLQIFETIKSTT